MNRQTRPVSRRIHPSVYAAIAGMALCYVAAVWVGFAGSGYTDYLLTIASFFVLGSLALPFMAWRVWRSNSERARSQAERNSFRRWAKSEVDVGQGRMRSATAAIEILLPLAAIAFGMMAFAILARLAS
jgi:hypothetical protein